MLLLALTSLSQAANLELVFNETSFSTNTSGTFRLTGFVPATGYGQSGFSIGSDYYADYYSFSSDYLLSFTAPPSAPFDFYLQAISASGTAVRDSTAYTIKSIPGIGLNIFGGSGVGQVQVYLEPSLNPNFGPEAYLPDNTQGTFLVEISGSFVANANPGGAAPSSQGVNFSNMEGTHVNQITPETVANALTITVPEPSTASLVLLSTLPLLLHRRRKIS